MANLVKRKSEAVTKFFKNEKTWEEINVKEYYDQKATQQQTEENIQQSYKYIQASQMQTGLANIQRGLRSQSPGNDRNSLSRLEMVSYIQTYADDFIAQVKEWIS